MPDQAPQKNDPPDADDVSSGGRGSLFGKIKVLLVVIGIIAVECLVAKLYLPNAVETRALAGGAAEGEADDPFNQKDPSEIEQLDQMEIDMEEFHVTAFQPKTETTLVVDFHLWGAIHRDDEADFERLFDDSRHRFRDQVLRIVRSAQREDLADAGLGLLRRKVLEQANRTLGEPLLKSVIISDFSYSVH